MFTDTYKFLLLAICMSVALVAYVSWVLLHTFIFISYSIVYKSGPCLWQIKKTAFVLRIAYIYKCAYTCPYRYTEKLKK